jgi:hypothetical protein
MLAVVIAHTTYLSAMIGPRCHGLENCLGRVTQHYDISLDRPLNPGVEMKLSHFQFQVAVSLGVALWLLVLTDKQDDIEWPGSRSDVDSGIDDNKVPHVMHHE